MDDVDIQELNICWLRTQLGIVSYEPILFDTSISDNIIYGANHCEVSDENSAKAANTILQITIVHTVTPECLMCLIIVFYI